MSLGLGPVQPCGEVLGAQLVALDALPAGLGVHRVQVQAVPAGDHAIGRVQVAAQLIARAGLAGVVAGGGDAAAKRLAAVLEAGHVVALPAVQAQRDIRQQIQRPLGIDAQQAIALLCDRVGRLDVLVGGVVGHRCTSFCRWSVVSGPCRPLTTVPPMFRTEKYKLHHYCNILISR